MNQALPLLHRSWTDRALGVALRVFAAQLNWTPSLRRWLCHEDGPLRFTVGIRTESGTVERALRVDHGRAWALSLIPSEVDTLVLLREDSVLAELATAGSADLLRPLLENRMRVDGNLGVLSLFQYLLSRATEGRVRGELVQARVRARARVAEEVGTGATAVGRDVEERLPSPVVPGCLLPEPFFAGVRLMDLPRLEDLRTRHFSAAATLCAERPRLLTDWYKQHGFETDADGRPWDPVVRQGRALRHLLEHRRPLVGRDDLLAGTTTAEQVGVVVYPDAHGTLIWGELATLPHRLLNPYAVSDGTIAVLHDHVLPFWLHRTFREDVRVRHGAPLCQRIDDRFAVYFAWKTVALSHTVPDLAQLVALGTDRIIADLRGHFADADPAGRALLGAMIDTLEGLATYGRNLGAEVHRQAEACPDPVRRVELETLAEVLGRVPAQGARTLHEAVQSLWIGWVGLHMENTNAGLSIGRLDQILQPYLAAELAPCATAAERHAVGMRALELVGCLFLRCADHLPLVPDLGNTLFGGSSSDQAITVGGVTADGEDAVVEMTWIVLKVTELLGLRDPNVNARFDPEVNSEAYLRRLCEVNLITRATPSIHGDPAVVTALEWSGAPLAHRRDWAATGCVEPTMVGRHIGHTGCLMFNLVAALEMALRDGEHPLMRWKVGPRTGQQFADIGEVFTAWEAQICFLAGQATQYNNMLGEAHARLRPTPLLSTLIDGCRQTGADVTRGGALYDSSGVACIGLSDVVDSLLALDAVLFGPRPVPFDQLLRALDTDFSGQERLLARIRRVPRFGSGDPDAVAMANRVVAAVHGAFSGLRNARGGPYTTGFWSMSNHVAFGSLTGALPSGRRANKAFSPGLTPSGSASPNLMDNLIDVAGLDPHHLDNNIAFNVKYVPSPDDPHAEAVGHIAAYVRGYTELGGMQIQLNVVSSEVLRHAMLHPQEHADLLVRISGYNAYFTTLNHDMQIELVERAEFKEGRR